MVLSSTSSVTSSGESRAGSAMVIGSRLAGRLTAADTDRALLGPADDLHLERLARCRERLDELIAIGDRLAGRLDDQVAGLDAGLGCRAAFLDVTDQQAVALGQANRPAQPAGD